MSRAAMRQALLALVVVLAVGALLGLYTLLAGAPMQRPAIVDVTGGRAEIVSGGRGEPAPLSAGQPVQPGDLVLTSFGSWVELRWPADATGTRVKIGPGTRFKIARAVGGKSNGPRETRLRVDAGKIWVRIREELSEDSAFEVETPTLTLLAERTLFSVAVDGTGASRVEVFEGSVEVVGRDGAGGTLTARSAAAISPGQDTLDIEALTAAEMQEWEAQASMVGPFLALDSPADGVLVERGSCAVAGRAEPGAQVFVNGGPVEVSREGAFLVAVPLEAGGNTVVVTARDGTGRETMILRSVPRAAVVE